jgi:Aspartyl protease
MPQSMKIPFRSSLALCLMAGLILASSREIRPAGRFVQVSSDRKKKADSPYSHLERLYKDHRYFELRDAVESGKDSPAPEMEFYKGAVDDIFNRLEPAVTHLRSYLEGGPSAGSDLPLAKETWVLLGDAYLRLGHYRKAAEAQRLILERYGTGLDAGDKTNRESQIVLWSALADVPPQTVEIPEAMEMAMENRHFPVRIKDRDFYFSYDTGASLSVLYQSAAEELGFALLGQGAKIQSGTGRWLDARVTVVPEMRLGRAVIRNAAFLVLPDDFFHVWEVRPGVKRQGLIGAPILAALKEITETRDGHFIIPPSPKPRPVQNMCFFGTKPITEVVHRDTRLQFFVDTGGQRTFLYPPFFRRYREEIQSRTKPISAKIGSVGGERTVVMHILNEFGFQAGGRDITLHKVMVHTEVTHSFTDIFDGTIGRDVLTECSRMTLNFESMSFVLE